MRLDRLHFEKKKRLITFFLCFRHDTAPCQPSITESPVYSQKEGHGVQRNLNDFAVMSRGILQTSPPNLAKFSTENCGP